MNLQECVERAIRRLNVDGVEYRGEWQVYSDSPQLKKDFLGMASFVDTSPSRGKVIPLGDRKISFLGKEGFMYGAGDRDFYAITKPNGENPVFFILESDDREDCVRVIQPDKVPEYMLAKLGE